MRYLLFLTLLLACVSARGENTKNSETKDSPYEQLQLLARTMQLIIVSALSSSSTAANVFSALFASFLFTWVASAEEEEGEEEVGTIASKERVP